MNICNEYIWNIVKKYVCYNKNKSQNSIGKIVSLYIYYVILIKCLLNYFFDNILLSIYYRQYNLIYSGVHCIYPIFLFIL